MVLSNLNTLLISFADNVLTAFNKAGSILPCFSVKNPMSPPKLADALSIEISRASTEKSDPFFSSLNASSAAFLSLPQ